MKTWSMEQLIFGIGARAAVVVQGILDAVEHRSLCHALGFDPDTRVWPESLPNGAKVTYVPKDGADQLADAEEQIDAWEPDTGCMWCGNNGCPECQRARPACTCPCINCSNQAHWMCHGEGVEIDTVHDGAEQLVACPTGGTCPSGCDRTEQGCVQTWGPADEHVEALRRNADETSAAGAVAEDSAGAVSDIPPSPAPARPSFVDWAVPAICTVLAEHKPSPARTGDTAGVYCHDFDSHHGRFADWQAWREHVALEIAEYLHEAYQVEPRRFPAMETGHDMGMSFASELFPQHQRPNK